MSVKMSPGGKRGGEGDEMKNSDPTDCSLPGSSVHGIFQATVLEWGAIAFSLHVSSTWQMFNNFKLVLLS